MAHSHLEILRAEINEYLRRLHESRCDNAETVENTRKSIDESRALIAEADAIMAKRDSPQSRVDVLHPRAQRRRQPGARLMHGWVSVIDTTTNPPSSHLVRNPGVPNKFAVLREMLPDYPGITVRQAAEKVRFHTAWLKEDGVQLADGAIKGEINALCAYGGSSRQGIGTEVRRNVRQLWREPMPKGPVPQDNAPRA
jgi:hypothetical protein